MSSGFYKYFPLGCHREERIDEAIPSKFFEIASLRSQ